MLANEQTGFGLVQGSEALTLGAIYAGVKFFAGYPITPATEIAEAMSRLMPLNGGIYFQGEDELACINALIGASWAGAKSMTATSGPGFSLMQEGIGYAALTETPMVVVDVMRGGPSTGQPTLPAQQDIMQAKFGSHGDYEIIALAPASVREMFTVTVDAINLSEKFRTPVILLADEIVAHLWEKVMLPRRGEIPLIERKKPKTSTQKFGTFAPEDDLIPPMPKLGEGYSLLVEGQLHDEYGFGVGGNPVKSAQLVNRLVTKITKNSDEITRIETAFMDDHPKSVLVSYGSVSRSARDAVIMLRKEGLKIGYVRIISLWPFPEARLVKEMEGVSKIYFPEMNIGKYADYLRVLGIPVVPLPKIGGTMPTPSEIVEAVKRGGDK
ncbi:MAG: 2-oxoacid:acceptor oxidoreductase subunit alpha [Nitrososphaerota archaeon]